MLAPESTDSIHALDRAWSPVGERLRSTQEPLVVLFSGGVDSGAIAWELRTHASTCLHTIGREGSGQLRDAFDAARAIGLPWTGESVDRDTVDRTTRRVGALLAGADRTATSVRTSLALAISRAPAGTLVCGQGADELFGGYAHFRGLAPAEAVARSTADLTRLREVDWPRTVEIARALGRVIEAPYLDPGFVTGVLGLPAEERLRSDPPKSLFRRWARTRGLPGSIADRPKHALQYSSGVDRLLDRSGALRRDR